MAPPSPKGLTVYVFNVGQGDHLLIEFPNGQYGVIDFYHQTSTTPNLLSTPALFFLEKRRLATPSKRIKLRFIHLTHPDLDHTKGVIEFLSWVHRHQIDLDEFWSFPGLSLADIIKQVNRALTATPNPRLQARVQRIKNRLERLDELIKKIGCREQVLHGVQHVGKIGRNVKAVALAPLGSHINEADQKQLDKTIKLILSDEPFRGSANNMVSSILKFHYGKHKLLFGGDASRRVWEECLDFYERSKQPHGTCNGNFIKVSHHGSKNSSSVNLWRKVLCERSSLAISAGRTKKPNHPDKETLKQIIRVGSNFNTPPKVVSTNMCSQCIQGPDARLKLVNWYAAPDKPKQEVQSMLRLIRAKGITQKRKQNTSRLDASRASEGGFTFAAMKSRPPEFAAYIYNFQPAGDSVILTRAVTAKLAETACLFGGKPKEKFPRCVLR